MPTNNEYSKKNVHHSGALGFMLRSGQVKSAFNEETGADTEEQLKTPPDLLHARFETDSGLEFVGRELIEVDPNECEPWEYANRLDAEMGDLNELMESIRQNGQLQPALIRPHPQPHDGIKYEIIFGRRRHLATKQLGTPLLAIKKNFPTDQDAIAVQDAENKFRKDISNYSNAILYKKLLERKLFKNDSKLAQKLGISRASLSELLSYTKIPHEIVQLIPNIHMLTVSMALKITGLLNKSPDCLPLLIGVAPEIGKSINTPLKLEQALLASDKKQKKGSHITKARVVSSPEGQKLFTLRVDQRGNPCIVIEKTLWERIDTDALCDMLKTYLENSGKESQRT